jgi:hypothetical protein
MQRDHEKNLYILDPCEQRASGLPRENDAACEPSVLDAVNGRIESTSHELERLTETDPLPDMHPASLQTHQLALDVRLKTLERMREALTGFMLGEAVVSGVEAFLKEK